MQISSCELKSFTCNTGVKQILSKCLKKNRINVNFKFTKFKFYSSRFDKNKVLLQKNGKTSDCTFFFPYKERNTS